MGEEGDDYRAWNSCLTKTKTFGGTRCEKEG